jgi:maltose alpha-D-glucosyltransferase/alpha-amylase
MPPQKPRRRREDPLWFKDAVIYETHVRSFLDTNADGIGDLRGLTEKLDYLSDLGVNVLWLLPFFPSPLRDDGYDIADYRGVHPDYGTLADFEALVEAAHRLGIRVLVELVVNHTSDQHPWFQRARRAPRGSPERDFYVWSDTDDRWKEARIIFTDTEKSNWTWDPEAKQYYWHRFFSHQPDLNFDNPQVLEEVLAVLAFWADLGVDAFRLDAVPYLVERDGTSCENLPETHEVIRKIRAFVEERYPGRMLLAEANQWPDDVRPYFGEGDECHMAFHFPLMPRIFMALRLEDAEPVVDIMRRTPPIPDTCQWALFLRNHDELTLEMVTSDERDYMYLAYSQDPRMRINLGIRRRLAPLVDNSRRRIELLHAILFSFPGTPVVYYGDEIGMGDNIWLHDRNGVRTPMQWSADRNAGFSRADPSRLFTGPVADPVYGYQAVNVEAQQRDPSSLLHWMRNMISLRKLFRAFGRGSIEFLPVANRKVLAYVRRHEDDVILCVANVSRFAQPAQLDLSAFEGAVPVEIVGYTEFPPVGKLPYFLTLGPYGFYWFELRRYA